MGSKHEFNFEAMAAYQTEVETLLGEQISILESEKSEHEGTKTELETLVAELTSENAVLESDNANLASQRASISEDPEHPWRAAAERARIDSQISANNAKISANNTRITASKDALKKIAERLEKIGTLIGEIGAGIADSQDLINKLAQAIVDADGNYAGIVRTFQTIVIDLNEKIGGILGKINQYSESYADSKIGTTSTGLDLDKVIKDAMDGIYLEISSLDQGAFEEITTMLWGEVSRDFFLDPEKLTYYLRLIGILGNAFSGPMVNLAASLIPQIVDGAVRNGTIVSLTNIGEVLKKFAGVEEKLSAFLGQKYILPVIMTLADFAIQVITGEDPMDAATKALAHAGLGWLVGTIISSFAAWVGNKVGGTMGTVILPVAGTVVGGILGTVAGVTFDYYYDKWRTEQDWNGEESSGRTRQLELEMEELAFA